MEIDHLKTCLILETNTVVEEECNPGGRRSLKKLSRRANKRSLKNRRTRRGGGGLTTSMELGLERLDSLIGNLHNHNHNNRI